MCCILLVHVLSLLQSEAISLPFFSFFVTLAFLQKIVFYQDVLRAPGGDENETSGEKEH